MSGASMLTQAAPAAPEELGDEVGVAELGAEVGVAGVGAGEGPGSAT
jgi:hypothetical protein